MNVNMMNKFKELEKTIISECGNKPVYYFANPGNWGDALIRRGALKIFNDMGLKFTEIKTFRKKKWIIPWLKGGTVIYGGGGAWCRHYDHSHYVKFFAKRFKVIVLPSTFEKHYSIPNTLFFRRDEYESKVNMPEAEFCHDMAFYIGDDFLDKTRGEGTAYFFRTDVESTGKIIIPPGNIDLSDKGRTYTPVEEFFEEINKHDIIYTDRLHIAIAGCLLNKKVHLYQANYFKIRAIYLSSMKDRFENLYFHEKFVL